MRRAKGDQLCTCKPKEVQCIRVVEVEGFILGKGNSCVFARRFDRRKRVLGVQLNGGSLPGKGEEFFTVTGLVKLLAKHGELLGTDHPFSGRDEAQMPLGYQVVQGMTKISQEGYAGLRF